MDIKYVCIPNIKIPTIDLNKLKYLAPFRPMDILIKTGKGNPCFWDGWPIKEIKKYTRIDAAIEEDKTKQFLRENNIGNNYIAIVPGAAWSQKQWSIDNYNNLIKKLIRSFNSTIVILGSTNDVICDKIIKHDKIINLKDKTSLRMAMGVVKYAQHTLGSDTGLLHISEAMGTPVTMILGPTSKETGARVTLSDSRVIENKDLWCRPCSQNGSRPCYRKEQYCMTEIDSEKVYSNVSRALTLWWF